MPRCVVVVLVLVAATQAVLAVTAQHHQHIAAAAAARVPGAAAAAEAAHDHGGGSSQAAAAAAPAAATEAAGHAHHGAAAAPPALDEAGRVAARHVHPGAPQDACVSTPTLANCSGYIYPQAAAAADLGKLCRAMPFMGACSVAAACNASGASPAGDPRAPGAANVSRAIPNVCEPFQLVTTVCRLDTGMGRMAGCDAINSMCVPGSVVPSCKTKGLTILPPTAKLNAQVRSICEEMTMDGCEKCMPSWEAGRTWADCDLLEVYSYLCYQMPEMTQCPEWHTMCKADPSLVFCYPPPGGGPAPPGPDPGPGPAPGPAAPGPVMKMYFFNELPFYLLFKSWTPRTSAQLAGAWLAIFALGLLYEFLQALYGAREAAFWAAHQQRAALAAAAASRALDEELGGPLAEGVLEDDDSARDAAGGSCCAAQAAARPAAAAAAAAAAAGAPSKRACCGGGAGGVGSMPRPDSAASVRSNGSGAAGKGYHARAAARGGAGAPRRAGGCWQPPLVAADVVRGAARFVLAGLAYLLMLAAMSFNVAIFFAVIAGVAVGSALFGRWRWAAGTPEGYSHCGCGSSVRARVMD